MADRSFLAWPFFEERHRDFAGRLDAWAGTEIEPLPEAHEDTVDAACADILARLGAIDAALEAEYQKRSDTTEAIQRAKESDCDLVTEKYWKPILAEIERGLVL